MTKQQLFLHSFKVLKAMQDDPSIKVMVALAINEPILSTLRYTIFVELDDAGEISYRVKTQDNTEFIYGMQNLLDYLATI